MGWTNNEYRDIANALTLPVMLCGHSSLTEVLQKKNQQLRTT